ncbi:hypothetical protein LINGRAHAP2_LOCUS28244 [Linum grandiflorum]
MGNEDHQHDALLGRFRKLRDEDWPLKIVYIYREANFVADSLAYMSHSATYGIHFLTSYPATSGGAGVGFHRLRPTSPPVQSHPTICIFVNFNSSA